MELDSEITIVGSGNVAWHLSHIFINKNIRINKVIGRNVEKVAQLAKSINVQYSMRFDDIPSETDLVLLCISDNAIQQVGQVLKGINCPVAHTAGSVSINCLSDYHENAGVFYPFQTFSMQSTSEILEFPVCIEAKNEKTLKLLKAIAGRISNKVVELDSSSRKNLHLSGVIANNFTNYLFTEAYGFLDENDIDTQLLLPIIQQTIKKIEKSHPKLLQTGPAARGSKEVIENHVNLLGKQKDLQDIYAMMSNKIMQYYKKEDE